jgi:hypothetical protein
MFAGRTMHQLSGLHVQPESIDRRISMSDDDFGDEDEIIVVHDRPLHSVEDATFKWYTDGERVFPVGRSKKNLLFPGEITFDWRISMGAGGLLMRLLAHDSEHIDVDDLVRESQARNDEDDPRDLLAELERVGYLVRDINGNLTLNRTEPPEDE